MSDAALLREWLAEEALNFTKMFCGEPRLTFVEWKLSRDERARTGKAGAA